MTSDRRIRLVRAAQALFLRRGFRATGIDAILEAAGVAKMTLYNHFGSKDALIHEVLTQHDAEVRARYVEAINNAGKSPRQRILAAFDELAKEVAEDDFRGGLFIRAAYEDADPGDTWRDASAEHKRRMASILEPIAAELGVGDPAGLSRSLVMMLDAGRVSAYAANDPNAAKNAKRMAEMLLDAA